MDVSDDVTLREMLIEVARAFSKAGSGHRIDLYRQVSVLDPVTRRPRVWYLRMKFTGEEVTASGNDRNRVQVRPEHVKPDSGGEDV